jgi:CelD/BcsL family acetyltransferase involved in cellulose biosynthesis
MSGPELLPFTEALRRHAATWDRLGRAAGLNPTLLPDWSGIVVDSVMDAGAVQVLVIPGEAEPRALLPLHVRSDRIGSVQVRIAEPVSSVISYHAEFVSDGDPRHLVDALLATQATLGWDVLRLAGMLADSPSAAAIEAGAAASRQALIRWDAEESPWLPVGTTAERLLAARDKRDRYLIRKHARDFEAESGSELRWFSTEAECATLLEAMLHVEAGSWKQAAGVAISGNARETAYYRNLLPWLARQGRLQADVAYVRREPAAYCLCYDWEGRLGCMKGTYREEFARLAVGHHAQDQLILAAADRGAAEFDFLGDADAYKLNWSRRTRRHHDYFVYARSGRGRWLGLLQRLRNRWRRVPEAAQHA